MVAQRRETVIIYEHWFFDWPGIIVEARIFIKTLQLRKVGTLVSVLIFCFKELCQLAFHSWNTFSNYYCVEKNILAVLFRLEQVLIIWFSYFHRTCLRNKMA